MATEQIPTTLIADDAVTNAKIGADAVSTTEIANDASISTSGNIATTGSGTLTVAGASNFGSIASGTLGSSVVFPAGSVLQVVTSTSTAKFAYTTSSTKFDNGTASTRADNSHGSVIDDLNVTLTTKKANSKFFVMINLNNCGCDDPESGYPFVLNVYSSLDSYATPIVRGDQVGSNRKRHTAAKYPRTSSGTYAATSMNWSGEKAGSVASGTSVTFKSCISSLNTQAVVLNYMHNPDSDHENYMVTSSTATVFEVAT